MKSPFPLLSVIPLVVAGFLSSPSSNAAVQSERQANGLLISTDACTIRLTPWSDGTVRVEAAPGGKMLPPKTSLAVVGKPHPGKWDVQDGADRVELRTKRLCVALDKKTGLLSFSDGQGKPLLTQTSWSFQPAKDPKRDGLNVVATFSRPADERLFGGGVIGDDFRKPSAEITLQNDYLQMHLPMLFSSRGYGFFWDNPSRTKLRLNPDSVAWDSPAGDLADFYVTAGPGADAVIADYRALTGVAPLFPKWAYGFWFSKNAFHSQQEILDAAKKFRERSFPIDMLVQDYFYWKPDSVKDGWVNWGSHEFVKDRYPDPKKMVEQLHDEDHIHFMAVIWAKFDPSTAHGKELQNAKGLFPEHGDWAGKPLRYYDPYNPKARKIYGRQVMDSLLPIGLDAFWMDGAEPEMSLDTFAKFDTAAGPASRVMDAFPLVHTTAVYEAQRARTADKRVVLLPRSAWVGEQRNAAISWTSDIRQDWKTLAWQIEGLQNYSILGLPYITTDVGGYGPTLESDGELFVRWFQWGAFCPIFRAHGIGRPFPWDYGEKVESILKSSTALRYRLLPYIYSEAGRITHASGTLMRPLVMDFPSDPKAVDAWDEFLFGPSLLVCPVYQCTRESVTTVDRFADLEGKPGGVTATFVTNGNEAGVREEMNGDFRFEKDPTDEQNRAKSVRIEGSFTPQESGDLQFEVSTGGNAQEAATVSMTIEKTPVASSVPAGPWQFPAFPFKGEAGKPTHFSLTTEAKHPQFRVMRKVPAQRDVYLPAGRNWYDFWTEKNLPGGQTITVETPLERIPLYVRAGTILPLGPDLQYANEKPADPIELRVYRGASGAFTIYEDAGDGYGYEKGAFATISLRWDEAKQTLTIGKRRGDFPGMLKTRTFRIVWVAEGHGIGGEVTATSDQEVSYAGEAVTVTPKH